MVHERPEVGHLVYDEYEHLGLVTEVVYLTNKDMYLISIEWYIDDEAHLEHYRVGRRKIGDGLDFVSLSYYTTIRDRYRALREKKENSQ